MPLSLCCKGSAGGEGVPYELLLLSAASCIGGAVVRDWSVDAIAWCFVSRGTWPEWAGTGESMRGIIRLVGVWRLTWFDWGIF